MQILYKWYMSMHEWIINELKKNNHEFLFNSDVIDIDKIENATMDLNKMYDISTFKMIGRSPTNSKYNDINLYYKNLEYKLD